MDTAILVPILHRAHRVAPLVESIRATCDARILFLCTPGDDAVTRAVDAVGCEREMVPWNPVGDFARKTNTGYRVSTEPLLFTGADDLKFHAGWLEAAKAALTPGIGVVGTNDLGNPRVIAGEHSTHSLVTRTYADEYGTVDGPGAIFCEMYPHDFCDDELIGTAKSRGAYAHAAASVVEHLHYNWGKAPADSGYLEQDRRMRMGRPIYQRRRRLWA